MIGAEWQRGQHLAGDICQQAQKDDITVCHHLIVGRDQNIAVLAGQPVRDICVAVGHQNLMSPPGQTGDDRGGNLSGAYETDPRQFTVSELGDDVDEHAFVVIGQIGQVITEVAEVIADADLGVVADLAIDRPQERCFRQTGLLGFQMAGLEQ